MKADFEQLVLDRINVRVVNVPMRRPIVGAVGTYPEWPFILLDVMTKDGVVGHSYIEFYLLKSASYLVPAIHAIADPQVGKPIAPLDCFAHAFKTMNLHGRQGVSMIASAALDMAIWDALAKAAGQPLAVTLGGTVGPVRAYNTNGLWLTPIEKLGREAQELVAEGDFNAVKIRLGRTELKDDLAAIAAVREAVGPDRLIMSDFNQALKLGDALHRLHALDDQGLYWFEEPVTFDSFDQYAQLSREIRTPIQMGENLYGPRDFYNAVKAGAADLYMPDLMRIGGVTGFMRSAAIAGAAGIPISTHLYPEFSAHLLRASETADWLEWRDWAHPLIEEPFEVVGGAIQVPNRPGAGITWNEKGIAKYLV